MGELRRKSGTRQSRMGGAMCVFLFALAACAASRPVPASQPQAASSSPYRIAPGDTLDIVVWGEDRASGTVQVRPDGMITVALVGDLAASTLTPEELAVAIREALAQFIDKPNVVVRVAAAGSRQFFVMGNVRSPGVYELRPGQTLIQALAVAGGFSEFANQSHVKIMRNGTDPIERDYNAVVRGDAPDVVLERGDTIVVP